MGEIIKPHSFEDAKRHIQSFSNRTSVDVGLDKVDVSGGFFGWGDHKVTGTELNNITTQIQNHLIRSNGLHADLIKEFGQVYRALESLDGEYIPAILSAVKGAETASNQAKAAQDDIKKTIEAQKRMITVLEEHKSKLDKLKHLGNIDEIWKDTKTLQKEIKVFKSNFENAQKQVTRLEASLKAIQRYADSLLDYEHLEEIDETWERVGNHEDAIVNLNIKMEDIVADIQSLSRTLKSIRRITDEIQSYEHWKKIDQIWFDVEKGKEYVTELQEIEKQHSTDINTIKKETEDLKQFRNSLEEQQYLLQIDSMWNIVQAEQDKIGELQTRIINLSKIDGELAERQDLFASFQENLVEQSHLFDIDLLWSNTDTVLTELKNKTEESDKEILDLRKTIETEKESHQRDIVIFKKQITNAYIIAGGAIGLGIVELILNMIGIL